MPDFTGRIFLKQFQSFIPFLAFIWLFSLSCQAQENNQQVQDSVIDGNASKIRKAGTDTAYHDPGKAVLYSAILPGLGQVYNRRAWKVPIIYVGFGTFGYFIDRNQRYYKDLKQALIDPDYEMKYFEGNFTEDQLTRGKDTYKRWRDLSIISTVGFYVLQIIDASVDAYMYEWDVGTDISLHLEPTAPGIPGTAVNSFGLKACLTF